MTKAIFCNCYIEKEYGYLNYKPPTTMLKRLLVGIFLLLSVCCIHAQGWENGYGGESVDMGRAVLPTQDGGFIASGFTTSFSPFEDVYIVRTDVEGDTLWTNSYGTEELREYGTSIIETEAGDFVLAGNNVDPTFTEEEDIYLLKIDEEGNQLWQRTYGGLGKDFGY